MDAFLVAFGVVFVAELGDKSQLLALAFSSRYRPWIVLGGIAVAAALMLGAAAAIGGLVGDRFPREALSAVAGIAFLAFAAWTLLDREDDGSAADADGIDTVLRSGGSAFATVVVAFLVAEFGDKTMLSTATLATRQAPVSTWLGAVTGMVAADLIAVVLGAAIATRVRPGVLRLVSAAIFAIVGVALLVDAVLAG